MGRLDIGEIQGGYNERIAHNPRVVRQNLVESFSPIYPLATLSKVDKDDKFCRLGNF